MIIEESSAWLASLRVGKPRFVRLSWRYMARNLNEER